MDYSILDIEKWNEPIEKLARDMGLDFYEQEFEIIGYRDMIAYEAYVGMPSRYPHWSFGKAFEKTRTLYKYDLTGLPYEMVINSDPCLAYLMKENTLLLQILTMAHVYGHNDFFKNNRLFREGTRADYTIEMFKTHANIIRDYIKDPSIGYENVEKILNAAHAIKLQTTRVVGEKRVNREDLKRSMIKEYMRKSEDYSLLEPRRKIEMPKLDKIPLEPEEDLMYFIMQYGELEEWQRNIIDIVRQETLYFIPQIETKIMNEGWASYFHYNILKELKLPSSLHLEFIKRHNDVIAERPGSLNPYFIGFKIFEDIDKRLGRDKIFEVRSLERDESFIRRYLTEEICRELNLFRYVKKGTDYVIDEVSDEIGWTTVRNTLASSCGMGMVPSIRVVDMSLRDRALSLEHVYDGRELNLDYAEATLKHLVDLWKHTVILSTRIGDKEVRLICDELKRITKIT